MLKKNKLVQKTIEEICEYYSNEENITGILKVENKDEMGKKIISLILIYAKLESETKYFGFSDWSDKRNICDDVVLLMYSRENIDFGLLSRFNFLEGQTSAFSFLADGEILYDRTGKYSKLQKEIKKELTLRRVRVPNSHTKVTRVN